MLNDSTNSLTIYDWFEESMSFSVKFGSIFRRSILLIIVFVVCFFFVFYDAATVVYNVIKINFEFNWKMSDVLFCLLS